MRLLGDGRIPSSWGTIGSGEGEPYGAEDVEIAPDGTVWVAAANERLQQFTSSGA